MYLNYQPGNGTRYEMYFIKSEHDNNVIVAVPNFNVCMEINSDCTVHWTYVLEKFSRGRKDFNECDASAMALAIAEALDCPYVVHTGIDGRWVETERSGGIRKMEAVQ